jgi:hypothetical protein
MKHTTTFDGDVFDDYNAGEYLMYMDPEDPFEEQIHVLQAKYARKAGIYGVAIRRNASVSTISGQDSVIFTVPETLGRKVGSKMNKASILYGCSSQGPLRSYTSYVGRAGSAGYEFPNGVVVVRTNAWQYEVKTPSGLFLLIDSYYNGDQQYFNTYLSVKAPAGSFSPKGYCGNYNGDASDDDVSRPAADGINFVDPKSNAVSYKKGRKSLFACSGELDIRPYGVESQDKSVSTFAAKYQMVSRSGTQGDFAKTFSALAEKSAVDGTESVDAAKYCEQHKEQIMNMLDQTNDASMKAHLTYLHSNSGYQTAWNACSKVCGGRYKPQFPDYPKPKNPICRHCIVDQCSQMEATEGGSTIGGNAARAASSLAKFETRLTSEQAF